MASYEEVFLAIAVKNKFLTPDDAAACLREHRANATRPVEALVVEKQLLTGDQAKLLAVAARKIVTGGTTTIRPASSPAEAGRPAAAPAAPPANPQEPIPGIRISGKLGVGGTATVFLAEETRKSRKVALKLMLPKLVRDEKAVRRFQREAQLLIEFEHENIVKGHAQGVMHPGLPYFYMEYLDGESAQQCLDREKSFPEAKALEIIMETAKAIEYMQSKGCVHRDIKPDNIMLLRDGRVKVLDLGFAQPIGDGAPQEEEETTSGTVQYMSPEQARGHGVDVRADIYSLGATLYHMIMGELPFTGADSLVVMAKQVMEALNSSEIKNRRISKHMHYFIERMMSKDKDLRYATPRELADDIKEQIEGFKSLEYRPEEQGGRKTTVMRLMNESPGAAQPQSETRPITRRIDTTSTTRRFSKVDEITRRFKKK